MTFMLKNQVVYNQNMSIFFFLSLFLLGSIFGSFACCQAWRIYYKNHHKSSLGPRSVCLSCKHQLSWFDNLPLWSWLSLKGRCRYCGKPIGYAEIVSELGLGLAFLSAGFIFQDQWLLLALHLILLFILTILTIYDAKWHELPTILLILAVILGLAIAILNQPPLISLLPGILLSSGTYLILYLISREQWVGGGDWLLALALALALSNWWLCLFMMLVANALASIINLPLLFKKPKSARHFPLGPFLIIAFVVVLACQAPLLSLLK